VPDIELTDDDKGAISRLLERLRNYCAEHPKLAGWLEVTAGALILTYGVNAGIIQVGTDVVGSAAGIEGGELGALAGGAAGSAAGALASKLIGGIGIAAMGGAIAVPAVALMGGGSLMLGLAGYAVGDRPEHPVDFDPASILMGGAALPVGLWFLIRGCCRLMGETKPADVVAKAGDDVIRLGVFSGKIVAQSFEELAAFAKRNGDIGLGATAAAAAGSAGAVAGAGAAAGSVTVLGSKTLGAAALSAGLVSAPIWPVVTAAAAAAGVTGLIAWSVVRKRRQRRP
jgi:hypothetical protein